MKANGGNHFKYSKVHVVQYSDQNLALVNMPSYRDGVGPSLKGEGDPAGPHLNPTLHILAVCLRSPSAT